MSAEPLFLENRPYLVDVAATPKLSIVPAPPPVRPTEPEASLTLARVTSSLQLLLAARRAARFSGRSLPHD
ncbi:MAG: hypothetical protein JO057_20000 [Chloroflexi bacterium]|nr:hypothetical protein [Chloroflexota bacterium]